MIRNIQLVGQTAQLLVLQALCSSYGKSILKAHSVMPESWPFFDRVLSVSGPGGVPYKNSSEAVDFYEQIARNLRFCGRWSPLNPCSFPIGGGNKIPDNFVQCLREKSAEEIQVSLLFFVKYFWINIYGNIE